MMEEVAQSFVFRPEFLNAVRRMLSCFCEYLRAKAHRFIAHGAYVFGKYNVVLLLGEFAEASEECVIGLQLGREYILHSGVDCVDGLYVFHRFECAGVIGVVALQDV